MPALGGRRDLASAWVGRRRGCGEGNAEGRRGESVMGVELGGGAVERHGGRDADKNDG